MFDEVFYGALPFNIITCQLGSSTLLVVWLLLIALLLLVIVF
jgi:hypothetical protein